MISPIGDTFQRAMGLELFQTSCKWYRVNVTQHLAEGFLETVDEKREQTAREVSYS